MMENNEEKQEIKKKRGRPSKAQKTEGQIIDTPYDVSYPEKLLGLMKQGYLDAEIYAIFNVTKEQYDAWLSQYEQFSKAHQIGLMHCQAHYLRIAKDKMNGKGEAAYKNYVFLTKNKLGMDGSQPNNSIVINAQTQILNTKTPEELINLVKKDLEYFSDNNVIDAEIVDDTDDSEDKEILLEGQNDHRPDKQD